jgi:cytochrome c553
VLGLILQLSAMPALAAPDEVSTQACAPCHGENGVSQVPMFPSLAGQQADYLKKQLSDFATGRRKSDVMVTALAEIKASDFPALAAYYSAQKPASVKVEPTALITEGRKLFHEGNESTGLPACSSCHLDAGEGSGRYPRVATQNAAYVLQQLHDFNAGTRHNDRGRPMREVTRLLTEEQMKAIAEYLAAL